MPTNQTQRPAPEPLGSGLASDLEHRPWIVSVEIRAFRGIMKGCLEELGQLTILTGTNGCGKSTVLDAILCGASPRVGDAVGRAVKRHPLTRSVGGNGCVSWGQMAAKSLRSEYTPAQALAG